MSATEIKAAMAKAFFASAYADQWEDSDHTALNPSGCDWMDLIPTDMDPAATHAAETLAISLESKYLCDLDALFDRATGIHEAAKHKGDRELTPEMFGHYLAMDAMGTGVGLRDAFGDAVADAIDPPYLEFGGLSLKRDYF